MRSPSGRGSPLPPIFLSQLAVAGMRQLIGGWLLLQSEGRGAHHSRSGRTGPWGRGGISLLRASCTSGRGAGVWSKLRASWTWGRGEGGAGLGAGGRALAALLLVPLGGGGGGDWGGGRGGGDAALVPTTWIADLIRFLFLGFGDLVLLALGFLVRSRPRSLSSIRILTSSILNGYC